MTTQNSQNDLSGNLPVLIVGATSVICFFLDRGNLWTLIAGIVLLLLLSAYRGTICETSRGRWVYSALWALNFLLAVSLWLPDLVTSFPGFGIRLPGGQLFYPAGLLPLIIWLIVLFICKAYYDRRAAALTVSQGAPAQP
jgi:hypothetical protein